MDSADKVKLNGIDEGANNYSLESHDNTYHSENYITDYTVTEGDVTEHQEALSITESQISDLQNYLLNISNENIGDLSDVDVTDVANDKILKYNSTNNAWEIADDENTEYTASDFNHNDLSNIPVNDHIDWTISQTENIHSDNYIDTTYTSSDFDHNSLTNTHNLTTDIDHNELTNYSADRHFLKTDVSLLDLSDTPSAFDDTKFLKSGTAGVTFESITESDITDLQDYYLASNPDGFISSYTNNYVNSISGDGNSTLTLGREGLGDLTQDLSHGHAAVTTSVNGFMSSTDKTKLNGIESGATKYTDSDAIAAIKGDGDWNAGNWDDAHDRLTTYHVEIGRGANYNGEYAAIAIGLRANTSGAGGVTIGRDSSGSSGVVIGRDSTDGGSSVGVILGRDVTSGGGFANIAMGWNASTGSSSSSMALGRGTSATHENSTALGRNASTTKSNQIVLGSCDELYTPGYIVADDFQLSSDIRYKNYIQSLNDIELNYLDNIHYFSFTNKDDKKNRIKYGTSAQELLELNPDFVEGSEDTKYEVKYNSLLIAENVRLKQRVSDLEDRLELIEKRLGI